MGRATGTDRCAPDGWRDRPDRDWRGCFIGGNAVVLPGTRIGDGTIVAAGARVSGAVPGDCIVAGNPARVVRRGVNVGRFGRLPVTDVQRRLLDTLHSA
ncbi:acyltransferase [Tsuneonella litorea]|uniref:acyltransferase n=1 Tax=Tsuneonella litorea TaxID=2976475 RepID=UPI0035CCDE4A